MKLAKEIYVDNRKRTVIECQSCGATTHVNAGMDTQEGQRLQLNVPVRLANLYRTYLSIRFGGLSLVLRRILVSMDRCHGYELVLGIGWKRLDVWVGWPGSGMTSMSKIEKESSLNHQQIIKTNLSMSNYLDQLREQVRLKRLGVKEQIKRPSGLPSLLDLIDTNTKDSKK